MGSGKICQPPLEVLRQALPRNGLIFGAKFVFRNNFVLLNLWNPDCLVKMSAPIVCSGVAVRNYQAKSSLGRLLGSSGQVTLIK
jgi:hypothetical protein